MTYWTAAIAPMTQAAAARLDAALLRVEFAADGWATYPYVPGRAEAAREAWDELDDAIACASEWGVDVGERSTRRVGA